MSRLITRREALRAGAASGGALGAAALLSNSLIARALAAPQCGSLRDIQHVVILVQENRSFDNYFGSYRGVRGFADPTAPRLSDGSGLTNFAQPGYPGGFNGDHLYPFHLNSYQNGECTNDINHGWGPQHTYWDGGKLDKFVSGHIAVDGRANGPLTMGYYTRSDLSFYYALADAFTICDHYYCSVIGPTDPNRLYTMSASLGPDGARGGPILSTSSTRFERYNALSWTTMPEQLEAHGVSWKIYSDPGSTYTDGDNTVLFFTQYRSNPTLAAKGLQPTYTDFEAEAAAGNLPNVSWLISPVGILEHPVQSTPPRGEYSISRVLAALTAKREAWAKTVLVITFDENGGFFDHVTPPLAPPGTPGEFLTADPLPEAAAGIAGPIGLGPRVPTLIVSVFSRGGFVSSKVFDHTSTLRFLETRFGAEVPNLSRWRRETCGDLTSALNLAAPDASLPKLPAPPPADPAMIGCAPELDTYPATNSVPKQSPGNARRASGLRH
jgi:phospholipase C